MTQNGCLEWTGRLRGSGPRAVFTKPRKVFTGGKSYWFLTRWMLAHRLGRDLEKFEFACHTCDNPRCINVDHLFLGDAVANNRDTVAKGRYRNGYSKTNPKIRAEIKRLYATKKFTQTDLAKKYGVNQVRISQIVRSLKP